MGEIFGMLIVFGYMMAVLIPLMLFAIVLLWAIDKWY